MIADEQTVDGRIRALEGQVNSLIRTVSCGGGLAGVYIVERVVGAHGLAGFVALAAFIPGFFMTRVVLRRGL